MLPNYLKAHLSFSGRGEYVNALGNGKKSYAFSPLLPHNHIWCFWTYIEEINSINSSVMPRKARQNLLSLCTLVHFQGSFNCNLPPKYHCCMLFIGSLVDFQKVKSGRRQRWVNGASVGLGIAEALQTSAGLRPAPRCSCCATMKAPGQGQSRWGALQTCAALALSAF